MRTTLLRVAVGLSLLWLLLVVLLGAGKYTPFPSFEFVHSVVVGAAVLTVVGFGQLVRGGFRRLAR